MQRTDPKTEEAIEEKIKMILSEHLGIPIKDLTNAADLVEDLNAEDLEIADLMTKLEKELSVPVSHQDSLRLKTVGDIIDFFKEG